MPPVTTILQGLNRLGERPALIAGDHRWSGAQVLEASTRAATWLRARGAGAGAVVHWHAGERPQLLASRLAALSLGADWSDCTQADAEGAITVQIDDLDALTKTPPALNLTDHATAAAPAAAVNTAIGAHAKQVAVLMPTVGLGGDIALAAWCAGACVQATAAHTTAAKALALLERCRADHAALPASLLHALLAHPALALSDLSALRRLLCEDTCTLDAEQVRARLGCELVSLSHAGAAGAQMERICTALRQHPSLADAAVISDAAGRCVAFTVPAQRTSADAPAQAERQNTVAKAVDAALAGLDLAAAADAADALGHTALRSMLNGLQRSGLFIDATVAHDADAVLATARVASMYRPLIRRWLTVLAEQGLLRRDGTRYRLAEDAPDCRDAAVQMAWDTVEHAWRASAGTASTIEYARLNTRHLPELIAGNINPVHLLFPEGRTELASALYRESVAGRYQHHAVAALVADLARRSNRTLRLLEVGAGTGATTETLLPALAGLPVDYLYTDVSRYFIEQAAERFSAHAGLRFGLYDIDRPGREQGYAPNRFDLIVAGGVLNAARNTDTSLHWLAELLVPGGWLMLTEPTAEEFWVMASQAFMLAAPDDQRADSQATFLSWRQWRQALDRAGLKLALDLPPAGHALAQLGHRMFAAQAKLDRHAPSEPQLREHLGNMAGTLARIEIVDALPLCDDGTLDHDLLRTWANQAPATASASTVHHTAPVSPPHHREDPGLVDEATP